MRRTALLLLCSLVLPLPARAEPATDERARELYAQGKAAYAQERYTEALARFEEAYTLSQAPALLFNMAQAHRLSGPGHCQQALALYRSYLAALPGADNEREVTERLKEMERCVERQPAPAAAAAPPKPTPPAQNQSPPPAKQSVTGPIMLTGFGAAAAVAGVVLYGAARHKYTEARERCPCYPGTYSGWETATMVSYGLMAAGGLTVAAGVSWWVALTPAPGSGPRSGLLGVRGQF